jgi:hypothetical protein
MEPDRALVHFVIGVDFLFLFLDHAPDHYLLRVFQQQDQQPVCSNSLFVLDALQMHYDAVQHRVRDNVYRFSTVDHQFCNQTDPKADADGSGYHMFEVVNLP